MKRWPRRHNPQRERSDGTHNARRFVPIQLFGMCRWRHIDVYSRILWQLLLLPKHLYNSSMGSSTESMNLRYLTGYHRSLLVSPCGCDQHCAVEEERQKLSILYRLSNVHQETNAQFLSGFSKHTMARFECHFGRHPHALLCGAEDGLYWFS